MAQEWIDLGTRRFTLSRQTYARDRYTEGYACPKCGRPIDWDLPYKDPATGQVNKWCKSIDHRIEVQDGGSLTDLDNLHTVHLTCNASKGAARRWQRQRQANTIVVCIDASTL